MPLKTDFHALEEKIVAMSISIGSHSMAHDASPHLAAENHVSDSQQSLTLTSLESKLKELRELVCSLSSSLGFKKTDPSTITRTSN